MTEIPLRKIYGSFTFTAEQLLEPKRDWERWRKQLAGLQISPQRKLRYMKRARSSKFIRSFFR